MRVEMQNKVFALSTEMLQNMKEPKFPRGLQEKFDCLGNTGLILRRDTINVWNWLHDEKGAKVGVVDGRRSSGKSALLLQIVNGLIAKKERPITIYIPHRTALPSKDVLVLLLVNRWTAGYY